MPFVRIKKLSIFFSSAIFDTNSKTFRLGDLKYENKHALSKGIIAITNLSDSIYVEPHKYMQYCHMAALKKNCQIFFLALFLIQ